MCHNICPAVHGLRVFLYVNVFCRVYVMQSVVLKDIYVSFEDVLMC